MGERFGGRAKGTPNKRTVELRELIEKEAGSPLPLILYREAMRCLESTDAIIVSAGMKGLEGACKFAYPSLKSVELTGEVEMLPPAIPIPGQPPPDVPPAQPVG